MAEDNTTSILHALALDVSNPIQLSAAVIALGSPYIASHVLPTGFITGTVF